MNKDIFLPPLLLFFFLIFIWEVSLYFNNTPHYIVPRPSLIIITLFNEWKSLFPALLTTLSVTFLALFLAIFIGLILAIIISQFKIFEISLMPITIMFQVTPIIAIAPLIVILVDDTFIAALICAWLVAFFPILSSYFKNR